MKTEALLRAKASFGIEAKAISDTFAHMDFAAFGKAVDALSHCARIGVTACGHSGIACMHFAHSMCCIERPSRFLSPSEAVHGALGFIQKDDVIVWASRGGKTSELIPILDICIQKQAIIMGITENPESILAKKSHILLPMKVECESDKYNSQSTASFIALSSVLDALQTAVLEETDYKNESFALIHPGGAVGERLNKRSL